jgi:hypothetical protein
MKGKEWIYAKYEVNRALGKQRKYWRRSKLPISLSNKVYRKIWDALRFWRDTALDRKTGNLKDPGNKKTKEAYFQRKDFNFTGVKNIQNKKCFIDLRTLGKWVQVPWRLLERFCFILVKVSPQNFLVVCLVVSTTISRMFKKIKFLNF